MYEVLRKYYLHPLSYNKLYLTYKYVLTLYCTQVRFETIFSKLNKLNRIRNYLGQSKLEMYLLMSRHVC